MAFKAFKAFFMNSLAKRPEYRHYFVDNAEDISTIDHVVNMCKEYGRFDIAVLSTEEQREVFEGLQENLLGLSDEVETELFEQCLGFGIPSEEEAVDFLKNLRDQSRVEIGKYILNLEGLTYLKAFYSCWDFFDEEDQEKVSKQIVDHDRDKIAFIAPYYDLTDVRDTKIVVDQSTKKEKKTEVTVLERLSASDLEKILEGMLDDRVYPPTEYNELIEWCSFRQPAILLKYLPRLVEKHFISFSDIDDFIPSDNDQLHSQFREKLLTRGPAFTIKEDAGLDYEGKALLAKTIIESLPVLEEADLLTPHSRAALIEAAEYNFTAVIKHAREAKLTGKEIASILRSTLFGENLFWHKNGVDPIDILKYGEEIGEKATIEKGLIVYIKKQFAEQQARPDAEVLRKKLAALFDVLSDSGRTYLSMIISADYPEVWSGNATLFEEHAGLSIDELMENFYTAPRPFYSAYKDGLLLINTLGGEKKDQLKKELKDRSRAAFKNHPGIFFLESEIVKQLFPPEKRIELTKEYLEGQHAADFLQALSYNIAYEADFEDPTFMVRDKDGVLQLDPSAVSLVPYPEIIPTIVEYLEKDPTPLLGFLEAEHDVSWDIIKQMGDVEVFYNTIIDRLTDSDFDMEGSIREYDAVIKDMVHSPDHLALLVRKLKDAPARKLTVKIFLSLHQALESLRQVGFAPGEELMRERDVESAVKRMEGEHYLDYEERDLEKEEKVRKQAVKELAGHEKARRRKSERAKVLEYDVPYQRALGALKELQAMTYTYYKAHPMELFSADDTIRDLDTFRSLAEKHYEEFAHLFPHQLYKLRDILPHRALANIQGDARLMAAFPNAIESAAGHKPLEMNRVDTEKALINPVKYYDWIEGYEFTEDDFYDNVIGYVSTYPLFEHVKKDLERIAKREQKQNGKDAELNYGDVDLEFEDIIIQLGVIKHHARKHGYEQALRGMDVEEQKELFPSLHIISLYDIDVPGIREDIIDIADYYDTFAIESFKQKMAEAIGEYFKQVFSIQEEISIDVSKIDSEMLRMLSLYLENPKVKDDSEIEQGCRELAKDILSGHFVSRRMWERDSVPSTDEERKKQVEILKEKGLIPKNITVDQYVAWTEDHEINFEEAFDVTNKGLRSGIQKIFRQSIVDHHIAEQDLQLDSVINLRKQNDILAPSADIDKRIKALIAEYPELKKNKTRKNAPQEAQDQLRELQKQKREFFADNMDEINEAKAWLYISYLKNITADELKRGHIYAGKTLVRFEQMFGGGDPPQPGLFKKVFQDTMPDFYNDLMRIYAMFESQQKILQGDQRVSSSTLDMTDKVDPAVYIAIGEDPVPSCQNYKNGSHSQGLLATVIDPNVKVIQLYDEKGLVARSVMRLMETQKGDPAIFIERSYSKNVHPKIDEAIVRYAKAKAAKIGAKVFSTELDGFVDDADSDEFFAVETLRAGTRATEIYSDAGADTGGSLMIAGVIEI